MTYNHVCTAGKGRTRSSKVAKKVSRVVQNEKRARSPEQNAQIRKLLNKISDLEARGFIKRQQFKAPTPADFERDIACVKRK